MKLTLTLATILTAASGCLAQQQYSGKPVEGAECGQDIYGNRKLMRRESYRNQRGATELYWRCVSDYERAATAEPQVYPMTPPFLPAQGQAPQVQAAPGVIPQPSRFNRLMHRVNQVQQRLNQAQQVPQMYLGR